MSGLHSAFAAATVALSTLAGSAGQAATFVIDGSGAGIVASTTGVSRSSYGFGATTSNASSFSQSFDSSVPLNFAINWNNPDVAFMTGISTRDIVFRNGSGRTIGLLRYAVNNNATAYQYVINGSFYDSELSGGYPTPQGTSVSYTTSSEYSAPDIGFLNMAFTVRLAGSQTTTPSVPEPSAWALMVMGFGFVGGAMRKRRIAPSFA